MCLDLLWTKVSGLPLSWILLCTNDLKRCTLWWGGLYGCIILCETPSSLVLPALHVQVEDQLPLLLCLGLYQQAVSKQVLQGLQVNVLCKLWIKQTGLKSSVSQTEHCFRSKCRRRKNNQVINCCSITFRSGRINLTEEEKGGTEREEKNTYTIHKGPIGRIRSPRTPPSHPIQFLAQNAKQRAAGLSKIWFLVDAEDCCEQWYGVILTALL